MKTAQLPSPCCTSKLMPSRSPPGVSKDYFEAIVRRLDVELGYVSKHVGTHVRENDAFALELRAMPHERRVVEMKREFASRRSTTRR